MRSIALDVHKDRFVLCEVSEGKVVRRSRVRRLEDLKEEIGPGTPPAKIAFEACRAAWHVYDQLLAWGHEPIILDTTRIRMIGVGQHGRKNDDLDAEAIARALEKGYIHVAHTLSAPRRELRRLLSIRYGFVSARTQQINILRGLALSEGVTIASCDADDFVRHVREAKWPAGTRTQIESSIALIEMLTHSIHDSTQSLHKVCEQEPVTALLATVPFVGLIGAATFISVIDDAGRFRRADQVASYLGLVPSENTSNSAPRLGSITKQGNHWARVALVEAAWGLIARGDPSDPLVSWGRDLAERRNKYVAAVALARKLAGVLWAMWKRNQPYDPKGLLRASSAGLQEHAEQLAERGERLAADAAHSHDPLREQQLKAARVKLRSAYSPKLTTDGARTKTKAPRRMRAGGASTT